MNDRFVALKNRWAEIFDLGMAASLLRWDQSTYMPPGGAPAAGSSRCSPGSRTSGSPTPRSVA